MDLQTMNCTVNLLIGNYFKKKRRECGLSGREIGDLLNISQQQISRYERGLSVMPLGALLFFLKKNNLSINDFFNYLENEINSSYDLLDGKCFFKSFSDYLLYINNRGK